jgi:hypothetical protein
MSSPKIFAFVIYDATTGLPKTGAAGSMTFEAYKTEAGVNVTPPTIVEIGGGGYYFMPVFNVDHGIFFVLNTANLPLRISGYLRPEDYATDDLPAAITNVQAIKDYQQGTWVIQTTGPDINRMVFYAPDGITAIAKYDLQQTDGSAWVAPAGTNTKRVKV